MAEPRFFAEPASLTLSEVMGLAGAEAGNAFDPALPITGAAAVEVARSGDICFIDHANYLPALAASAASACFCTPQLAGDIPGAIAALVVKSPGAAFAATVERLFPEARSPLPFYGEPGIAAGARVHPSARLEPGVTVEPGAVVGPGVEIGSGTTVGATAVVGPSVRIGRNCFIGAAVSAVHALIGDRVIVHSGTRIGQDGFGFIPSAAGHRKIPQIGRVIIQDDVEIGANCCIDRGSNRDTVIGQGSKIDNLVQIAHNVVIGRNCLIAGMVGISGSVTVGDFVAIGGGAGISDHVTIGDGARISASAGLMRDVPAGARWGGIPAGPLREYFRMMKALERLGRSERKAVAADEFEQDHDGEGR